MWLVGDNTDVAKNATDISRRINNIMFRYAKICEDAFKSSITNFGTTELELVKHALNGVVFESDDVNILLNLMDSLGYSNIVDKIDKLSYVQKCALIEAAIKLNQTREMES